MAGDVVRIAGRYRLEDRVSDAWHSTVWKAVDDVLARPVSVRTFAAGFSRYAEVVGAARAACRVTDQRLERVFDANAAADPPYIVTEWPAGDYLDDILAMGHVDATWAVRIIGEAASALAAAHAAGIAHLRLTPRSLRWSRDTGLKIMGIGVEAALAEPPPHRPPARSVTADPALTDTRALARLLYAMLTGHWPGTQHAMLPAAPQQYGRPYRPRQVRAGVPARIDEITCRALFDSASYGKRAITSPAELAELLYAALQHDVVQPGSPAPRSEGAPRGVLAAAAGAPAMPRRRRKRALAGGLVGALFVVDSAIIGVSILGAGHVQHVARTAAQAPRTAASQPHRAARPLTAVSAGAFDPYGDLQDENNEVAGAAIDGNPATAWHTFWYTTPRFGNLKPGTGLLLDMGRPVTITSAQITLGAAAGADIQLRIGAGASLSELAIAAAADDVGGQVNLRPASAHRGRYVLIWFTKLPPRGDGSFEADVFDVALRGY